MSAVPKIFCVGFHKTGTTSLYAALTTLGFKVTGTVGEEWRVDELERDGAKRCIDIIDDFDAAEDMPWPLFFRELDDAYPGSKFILTVRDAEDWYASLDNHFGEKATNLNAFTYGRECARARYAKETWVDTYNAHNAAVREYFQARPDDLLEMDLASGDGWEKLCRFLEKPVPGEPFPIKNSSAKRRSFAYRLKRRLLLLAGIAPHPERLQ